MTSFVMRFTQGNDMRKDYRRFANLMTFFSLAVLPAASLCAQDIQPYSPLVSFGTLPALQVTTPIPGSTQVPGDVNGDGTSDLLWFNPALSEVGYWTMSASVAAGSFGGGVTRTGLRSYKVTSGYFVGAVGDFNNDGYADLVFTSANRDLWLWTNNQQGGWRSARIGTYPSQWQLIGAGDIDGDGYDDLLWLDPSECKFAFWTMRGAIRTSYKVIDIACGYYPVSIGYYSPSNRLSLIWTSPAGDLYVWDATSNGFKSYNLTPDVASYGRRFAIGGGYRGQGIGIESYDLTTDGTYDAGNGSLYSRTFDTDGNQTSFEKTPVWAGGVTNDSIGSGGYVIEGNGINATGIFYVDPVNEIISTGGLSGSDPTYSGNAPLFPALVGGYSFGNNWPYPTGWWVIGAPINGATPPPWQ